MNLYNKIINYLNEKLLFFPVLIFIIFFIVLFGFDKVFSYISLFRLGKNLFWAIAISWSVFLALYAFQLHNKQYADNPKDVKEGYGRLRWSQRIHQFVLNFLGGMIGWIIIYSFNYTNYFDSFMGWEKLVLFFIVYLAIMGYLPYTLIIKSWLPGR